MEDPSNTCMASCFSCFAHFSCFTCFACLLVCRRRHVKVQQLSWISHLPHAAPALVTKELPNFALSAELMAAKSNLVLTCVSVQHELAEKLILSRPARC